MGKIIFDYFTVKRKMQTGKFLEEFLKASTKVTQDNFSTDILEVMIDLENRLGDLNNIGANDDPFSSDMSRNMKSLIPCK